MRGPLNNLVIGAWLLQQLRADLRHPLRLAESREILARRLARRSTDFLSLIRLTIYAQPLSPYRQLLRLAGCEYGDLERLVCQEGVEGTLRALYLRGVYLTVEEFKGRRPVVRGSATVTVNPSSLRNPCSVTYLPTQSSGSHGPGSLVPMDIASLRERAVNTYLSMAARGGEAWVKAIWGVPGGSLATCVRFSSFTTPVASYFVLVDPTSAGLDPIYRWGAWAARWGSLLAGKLLPAPRYVPLEDPLPIAHWLAEVLRSGRTPHLWAFVSPAVHLCRAALEAGIDISGARLTVTGEPVTAARLEVIRRAGAEAMVDYGSTESNFVGHGCLAPSAPDDVHFFDDLHALIQPADQGGAAGLPPRALLISSLRRGAPVILLNVSMGDQAEIVDQRCGCPLERLGWSTHLRNIRSFEKLTAGGMTFLDTDVVRVLEEILPARFGGGPTDYQLVEEEAEAGRPGLRLLVHPAVGPLDTEALVDCFLAAIGGGSGAQRIMALAWRQAGLPRVERRPPLARGGTKILHVYRKQLANPA